MTDNAHLVKAAPLMLEALEDVVRKWDATTLRQNNPELEAAVNNARAAIAAARGEELAHAAQCNVPCPGDLLFVPASSVYTPL